MELWDVLDEYHLLVPVWIKNNQGEFLITKRAPNKAIFPNMWETTVGAVMAGEDSFQAALREIKEEIGINLTPGHGNRRLKIRNYDFQAFIEVWLFQEEVDITNVIYQPEEVCDASGSSDRWL